MDCIVVVNSDFAGIYILAEYALHPLPTSIICKVVI